MPFGNVPAVGSSFFGLEYTEPLTDALPPSNLPYSIVRLNGNGMDWGAVSTSDGTFTNWTAWEGRVAAFVAAGKEVNYCVGNQNGSSPTPPAWVNSGNLVTQYAAWCDAVLTQAAGRVKYLSVWNEPDAAALVTSASVLVTLAQTLYNKVQTYNTANGTTIKVIGPGVSGADDGTTRLRMLQDFFTLGGGAYVDIIDFHAYPNSVFPERIVDWILNARQARDKIFLHAKPIWITECGTSTSGTPDADDRQTFKAMTLAWAATFGVSLLSRFAYNYANFNLWDSTNGLNADGLADIQVNNWLSGATITGSTRTSSICTIELTRAGGYRAQILRTADRSTPAYTVPAWAHQTHTLDGTKNASLGATVTLGFKPILLESGDGF